MGMGGSRVRTVLAIVMVVAGVAGGVWFLLGPLAGWLATAGAASITDARGECIQATSVLGGLLTVGYGIRRFFLDRDKQRLEEDKQVTDRFSNAVAHLGSEDETVRAGGVRALERIMRDSPRDHDAVLETLCGLLRHRARPETVTQAPAHPGPVRRPADDVTAAVAAVRQRPVRAEAAPLDLAGVHLPGANLRGARLDGADLTASEFGGAVLSSAILDSAQLNSARLAGARLISASLVAARLTGAVLTDADLDTAQLTRACLDNATLENANLAGADFSGASLHRARLRGARLSHSVWGGADLTDADLRGADLRTSSGLTADMLRAAVTDDDTLPPEGVSHSRPGPVNRRGTT